ncbi:CapA family protein [Microbulbifer yueqingensis]|uniref:UDP-N-acetylmuramyl pentapeptide synthase n=1 Tax=Microbulbifer yueqingensis TaxID=658219 RepID=A0A1G9E6H4_9GAMM|nr:CapA family protein [Microbulbifer yueqingensis]SDK71693.1 UDP-N-acetylmuramyl pentapeptide synthase [Microbulbifer yueqingensis]
MTLSDLLLKAKPLVERKLEELPPPYLLFVSVCDGKQRAVTLHARSNDLNGLWKAIAAQARKATKSGKMSPRWLRLDWVTRVDEMSWGELKENLRATKRSYFRYGIALDADFKFVFLEQELNGNAMLYGGNQIGHAVVNEKNFQLYCKTRYGNRLVPDFSNDKTVYRLWTEGVFCDETDAPVYLYGPGRNAGRRIIDDLDEATTTKLVETSSNYLAGQVKKSGRFEYGWHACFDKPIGTYNTLRHASSTYAMAEAWEVTREKRLKAAIERSLTYLDENLIQRTALPSGEKAAFLVEANGEIKLGGNAVCLLAYVKWTELTGSDRYRDLMEQLALGIRFMQDDKSGKFVHVLQFPDLSVKEEFRIIYYDGEAAFGLMRLYGLTGDERWLTLVEKAFEYFIAADHWQAHDHWLSYCVNELTLYRPAEKYYRFGIQNVAGYLDFIENRITTFPTLLELMMAAEKMVTRLSQDAEYRHLLQMLDLDWFYRALHKRANYLLNGYFWPEFAMFYRNPQRIVGSFFIRHHAFRVRIDDVEHYLSGFVAYRNYLRKGKVDPTVQKGVHLELEPAPEPDGRPVLAWGGDVNLARRQHYRTAELGTAEVLGKIPALSSADLTAVNLECVVATCGEQGADKGELSPYYYRARPGMLRLLVDARVDVVTTANNHSGDYGTDALLEQCGWLDRVGIGHTGSGASLEQALTPVIRPAGELNVAIFSIDATQKEFAATAHRAGSAFLPLEQPEAWTNLLEPRIRAARQLAQVVMVAVHWGPNREEAPGQQEIATGHAIIDAGADAVLGTSAHVLQGTEIYRERPIIHDAGDLLFDSVRNTLADSGVFRLALSERGVERLTFVPAGCGFGFSRQLKERKAIDASRRYAALSAALGTAYSLTEDGTATLALSPPERATPSGLPPAAPTAYRLAPLHAAGTIRRPEWQVPVVPEDARIDPVRIGPLLLVGIRLWPREIKYRQMLWVESFWACEAEMDTDYRLDFRAVPIEETTMPEWGKSMDHDPCDWQLPTSRWEKGVIYRDFYGLRPPHSNSLENVDLQLQVGLVSAGHRSEQVALDDSRVHLDLGKASPPTGKAPIYRTQYPPSLLNHDHGLTWDAEQLEVITGGRWLVPPPAGWAVRSVLSGISFVEQSPGPALFVAHTSLDRAYHEQSSSSPKLWDMHDRLLQLARRIAGAIVARPVPGLPPDLPLLLVDDPIRAIIELGLAARARYDKDVIAITGTAGKSTTLKMIGHLLGGREKVLTSLGNYNSRVGAPSMLASLSPDDEAAVIEVAQSALWMKRGPITRLIRPTIALITEIGISQSRSHVRSTRDTARWKSRIFDGLTGPAIAIIGDHLKHFQYLKYEAEKHARRVIVFGPSTEAEVRIRDIQGDDDGSWVTLEADSQTIRFRVPAPSQGMVMNAVASLCVLYAMGRELQAAAETLASIELDDAHLSRSRLTLAGKTVSLIDDSWNATVSSMLNAFSVLAQSRAEGNGRKIAVLGRIVHLGDKARELHESLAGPLAASGADRVITHGDEMKHLRGVLPESLLGPHFSTARELSQHLVEYVQPGDLLLLKGSRRDSDFGAVAGLLAEESTTSASPA